MHEERLNSGSEKIGESHYLAPLVGYIAGADGAGVLVSFDGRDPVRARLFAAGIDLCDLMRPERVGREVLISCEAGDPMRPIITGVSNSVLDELEVGGLKPEVGGRRSEVSSVGPQEGTTVGPANHEVRDRRSEDNGQTSGESSAWLPERLVLHGSENDAGSAPAPGDHSVKKTEIRVDGKRIVFEADDEIELRCGKSSITLKRSGKIVIKGSELLSRASGTNRIKGGRVGIN